MIKPFLEFLQFEKRSSAHTVKSYQTDLEQFQKYLLFQYDCAEPEMAKAPMLRSWVVSMMEEGLNPSSINRKIAALRTFYGYLRKKKHIDSDPTKTLSALKARKKLPAFVEEKSMEMLFEEGTFPDDFEGLRDRVIMELLYGSGIRLSELVELELKDLNLSARTIRVFGKRSKERIVPVSTSLVQLLQKYIEQRAPEENTDILLLTDSNKAIYPVFVQRKVKQYLSAVTTLSQKCPHVLRHS